MASLQHERPVAQPAAPIVEVHAQGLPDRQGDGDLVGVLDQRRQPGGALRTTQASGNGTEKR